MPINLIDKIAFRKDGVTETYTISNSVPGYLNSTNGKFYKESTYTTEIDGIITLVYVDLSTNYLYRYDDLNEEFVQIGGSGSGSSDAIVYVNSLPSSNIKDVIYGMITKTSYTETIADEFLDNNNLFEKTPGSGADYTYTAADGTELEASDDGISYKSFVSLAYDGSSDWTLTYADASSATLADGDSFYFKSVNRTYYAGNETEQSVTPFASGGGGGGATYLPGTGIDITNNIISVEPATNATLGGVKPDNSTIVADANGTISGNYQAGHGITITGNEISDKTFIGTEAEWEALTPAQQAEYDMVSISDDGAPVDLTPGHTIQDETTTFPQRSNLQFEDMTVTDDSTNGITKVAPIPYTAGDKIDITNNEVSCDETVKGTFIGTKTEWEALSTTDKAKYDIVNLTDDAASPSVVVDIVADGNMNAVTSNAVADALQGKANTADLGTAAAKDFTTSILSGSADLITSGAVYNAINKTPAFEKTYNNAAIATVMNDFSSHLDASKISENSYFTYNLWDEEIWIYRICNIFFMRATGRELKFIAVYYQGASYFSLEAMKLYCDVSSNVFALSDYSHVSINFPGGTGNITGSYSDYSSSTINGTIKFYY